MTLVSRITFHALPNEIALHCLSFCKQNDLISLMQVDQHTKNLALEVFLQLNTRDTLRTWSHFFERSFFELDFKSAEGLSPPFRYLFKSLIHGEPKRQFDQIEDAILKKIQLLLKSQYLVLLKEYAAFSRPITSCLINYRMKQLSDLVGCCAIQTLSKFIRTSTRSQLVLEAARDSRIDYVEALLSQGRISRPLRSAALYYAACNHDISIMLRIIKAGTIDATYREHTLRQILPLGHTFLIKTLLDLGKISTDCREHCIDIATERNFIEITQLLLISGPICSIARGICVVNAVKNGSRKLVTLLLEQESIPLRYHRLAIWIALRHHPELLENLMDSSSFNYKFISAIANGISRLSIS